MFLVLTGCIHFHETNLGFRFALIGDEWSKEAADTLLSLTNGVILQAQVVDYTPDNIPEVYLFRSIAKDVSRNFFSIIS